MTDLGTAARFETHADGETLIRAAAAYLLGAARAAIEARGRFLLVLAGGRTPLALYQTLAEHQADWTRWHFFLGDERCVPPDHPERTSAAIARLWLDPAGVPASNRHFIQAERGPEAGAEDYAQRIRPWLPFDLALLGMGEDGHVASLFPGQPSPPGRLTLAVHKAPKPPAERVSLSAEVLADATRERLILVTGAAKREALRAWRAGQDLPIAKVGAGAQVLMDADAAGVERGG
ncbi:MAG: 6-phosphogluconolactonase [Chromatiaceae bacterium]|nr:6-phosphogluconolactonase [Chromatiaceae bacterium]